MELVLVHVLLEETKKKFFVGLTKKTGLVTRKALSSKIKRCVNNYLR
jgi:hypothetical protein